MSRAWYHHLRILCWINVATVISGCGSENDASRDVVRRDSAGVTIVENPAILAHTALPWTVDTLPHLDIGKAEGEEPYQLFRVATAVQLADGRILVVNSGTQELRFFDARGSFLNSVGGPGEGPGEYRYPQLIPDLALDTLRIFDMTGRVTVLDAQGALIRIETPRTAVRQPIGVLSGRLVTAAGSARAALDTPEGIVANDITYESIDPAAAIRDTLFEIGGFDLFLSNTGGRIAFTRVPFDAGPSAAVAENRLYVTPGETPDVLVMDSAGELRQVFRIMEAPEPVTRTAFDRIVEENVARASGEADAAELRRRYGLMPMPEHIPFFQNLLIDASRNLWLQAFTSDDAARPEWVVLDPTGRVLGRLATPRSVSITQIGHDHVLGIRRDDADVEHVVRFRLQRS
jgi:hypothetical protein